MKFDGLMYIIGFYIIINIFNNFVKIWDSSLELPIKNVVLIQKINTWKHVNSL
jgi:hypothetical protein